VGWEVVNQHAQAANSKGCLFIPVVLSYEAAENERRIRSQERLDLFKGSGKMLDTAILKDMRERGTLGRWECKELLKIDVTTLEPEEIAANHIAVVGREAEVAGEAELMMNRENTLDTTKS
jgi:hypothetical protein